MVSQCLWGFLPVVHLLYKYFVLPEITRARAEQILDFDISILCPPRHTPGLAWIGFGSLFAIIMMMAE